MLLFRLRRLKKCTTGAWWRKNCLNGSTFYTRRVSTQPDLGSHLTLGSLSSTRITTLSGVMCSKQPALPGCLTSTYSVHTPLHYTTSVNRLSTYDFSSQQTKRNILYILYVVTEMITTMSHNGMKHAPFLNLRIRKPKP